jgi:hypothetical protein
MKNLYFIILSCIVLLFYACKPKVDIEKETEAIKALINNETQAFLQKDTAKVLSYYVHDAFQTRLSADCDTVILYRGWREVSEYFKNINLDGFRNPRNTKDFIQIKVMDDAAWAIYKDNWTYDLVRNIPVPGGMRDTIITVSGNIFCTMNLEKKADEWKISGFSLYSLNN